MPAKTEFTAPREPIKSVLKDKMNCGARYCHVAVAAYEKKLFSLKSTLEYVIYYWMQTFMLWNKDISGENPYA